MNRLVPHPNVVVRRLDESVVLVHLDTNRIFTLNRTGGRIWELLADHGTSAQLEAALSDEFDAPPAELHREVVDLVDQLRREQLVIDEDPPSK